MVRGFQEDDRNVDDSPDGIPDSLEGLPVPEWHQKEIEKRLESANANPDAAIPWEQVRARLRKRT